MSYRGLGLGLGGADLPAGAGSLPPSCKDAVLKGAPVKTCAKDGMATMAGLPPGCLSTDSAVLKTCAKSAAVTGATTFCNGLIPGAGGACGSVAGLLWDQVSFAFTSYDSRPKALFGGDDALAAQLQAELVANGGGAVAAITHIANAWWYSVKTLTELHQALALPGGYSEADIAAAFHAGGLKLYTYKVPEGDLRTLPFCHTTEARSGYAPTQVCVSCKVVSLGGYSPWATVEYPPGADVTAYVGCRVPEQLAHASEVQGIDVPTWLSQLDQLTRAQGALLTAIRAAIDHERQEQAASAWIAEVSEELPDMTAEAQLRALAPTPEHVRPVQMLLNPVLYLLGRQPLVEDGQLSPALCGAIRYANTQIYTRYAELHASPPEVWAYFQKWIDAWNAAGALAEAWCRSVPEPWTEPKSTAGAGSKAVVLVAAAAAAAGAVWYLWGAKLTAKMQ